VEVVREDDITADDPRIGSGPPSFQKQIDRAIVRKQRAPSLCANREEDDDRTGAGFDCGEMGGSFPVWVIREWIAGI